MRKYLIITGMVLFLSLLTFTGSYSQERPHRPPHPHKIYKKQGKVHRKYYKRGRHPQYRRGHSRPYVRPAPRPPVPGGRVPLPPHPPLPPPPLPPHPPLPGR